MHFKLGLIYWVKMFLSSFANVHLSPENSTILNFVIRFGADAPSRHLENDFSTPDVYLLLVASACLPDTRRVSLPIILTSFMLLKPMGN